MEPRIFIFYLKEPVLTEKSVYCAGDVYERMKDLVKSDQETFWLLGYDNKNREIYRDCLFIGGITSVNVDVRILFKRLLISGSSAFVVLHNHPTLCAPSSEDRALVNTLKMISNMLDLRFLDSIIVADDGFWSFYDNGLM
jgi:DNA repair protein RadC